MSLRHRDLLMIFSVCAWQATCVLCAVRTLHTYRHTMCANALNSGETEEKSTATSALFMMYDNLLASTSGSVQRLSRKIHRKWCAHLRFILPSHSPTIAKKMCTNHIIFHVDRLIIVSILLVFRLTNLHPEKSISLKRNGTNEENKTFEMNSNENNHFMI